MTSAPIDLADRQTTLPAINNRVILREIQKRFSRLRIFVYLDKPQLSPKVAPETVGSSFLFQPGVLYLVSAMPRMALVS
jgi:hypothetical protein